MRKIIKNNRICKRTDQRGVTVVIVAILIILFIGIAALAIDVSNLYAVRNELQNAADAGALAGARVLYDDLGTQQIHVELSKSSATATAASNKAMAAAGGSVAVEVDEIQLGHWSWTTPDSPFTPIENPVWKPLDEAYENDFVNAVKVVTRRQTLPAASFFAGIFGYDNFFISAEAIAYRGFAGKLMPGEVDLPIVICAQTLTGEDTDGCCPDAGPCTWNSLNVGVMADDGSDTAAWTNFTLGKTATPSNVDKYLADCDNANPDTIDVGATVGTTNGVDAALIPNLINCWKVGLNDLNNDGTKETPIDSEDPDDLPDIPWNVTLLVTNCSGGRISNEMEVCGAVNLDILWITDINAKIEDAPYKMDDWQNASTDGQTRWNSFATKFQIYLPNTTPKVLAPFQAKTIYFGVNLTPNPPAGGTGGANFGVLAKYPVLVK